MKELDLTTKILDEFQKQCKAYKPNDDDNQFSIAVNILINMGVSALYEKYQDLFLLIVETLHPEVVL